MQRLAPSAGTAGLVLMLLLSHLPLLPPLKSRTPSKSPVSVEINFFQTPVSVDYLDLFL